MVEKGVLVVTNIEKRFIYAPFGWAALGSGITMVLFQGSLPRWAIWIAVLMFVLSVTMLYLNFRHVPPKVRAKSLAMKG